MRTKILCSGALLALVVLISACSGGGGKSSNPTGSDVVFSGDFVEFDIIQGRQITQIRKAGIPLLNEPPRGGGGGHYIIGDCDGSDSERNIWSVDGMADKAGCPAPPYTLSYEQIGKDRVLVRVAIGPVQRKRINSIKTALDGLKSAFTHFQFAGDSRGPIQFNDNVSVPVAAGKSRGRVAWVEMSGPGFVIRRTPRGQFIHIQCNNHPGANNCDIEFGSIEIGQTVQFEEEIWVR